ncbi:TRAP transporter large permease subunit [Xanthobacter oligotrophicus]|uniref:TRAP transporter large permease n=1 Tax=Xanthobacter oligotrophicus TaxID=2607286 RepID=UPI0011F330D2|nr:TRAP transporter large permease subunit [Xanthobacter oligotrophicus]MCG5236324.1 TRAP transporter large permease subunit [Xanthobacter oligotrophicus]
MQIDLGLGAAAPAVQSPFLIRRLTALIRSVTGIAVAALVAAEMVVLFAGVVARYLFHRPLIWTDELAGSLFLWLAMLGAVVAFERGEHMRMSAFVGGLRSPLRGFFEALAVAVPLLFLALAMGAAVEFAVDEAIVTTPALDISAAWRVSALPVGFGLMLVLALLRLAGQADWRATLAAVVLVVATAAAFSALHPYFTGLGNLNLVIFFVGLVGAMVLAGIPIAFAFATATFGYICLTTRLPHTVVIGRMDEGMSHFVLLSVPLFVFLGLLIEMTGMARAMVAFLASLLGHVRGGLQYVLVGAMYLVSGISGSKAADMAAIAPVLLPEMEKRGAQRGELLALLSATGAQTETIPPSLVLITVGSVTGVSIAALFAGGLLPAVVLGALLCAVVWWRSRGEDLSAVRRASLREIASAFVVALPALALPFIIRAAVIEGVATATEVSTIGVAYAALAGLLIYRRFDWKRLYPMLVDTAALSGAILLIIGAATAMAWALTQSGFSASLAKMMMALPGGPFAFLLVSLLAFVVLGSVLEGIPAIVLFGPLLFPIARQVGLHEVHYAMVVILAMGIGLFAPPFGVGYYAACAISRISPDEGMRPMLGYMAALLIGTLIVAAVPWISTGFL